MADPAPRCRPLVIAVAVAGALLQIAWIVLLLSPLVYGVGYVIARAGG